MKQFKTLTALLLIAFIGFTSCEVEDINAEKDLRQEKIDQLKINMSNTEMIQVDPLLNVEPCSTTDSDGHTYNVNIHLNGSVTITIADENGEVYYTDQINANFNYSAIPLAVAIGCLSIGADTVGGSKVLAPNDTGGGIGNQGCEEVQDCVNSQGNGVYRCGNTHYLKYYGVVYPPFESEIEANEWCDNNILNNASGKVEYTLDMDGNLIWHEAGCGWISYVNPDGTWGEPEIDPNIGCV